MMHSQAKNAQTPAQTGKPARSVPATPAWSPPAVSFAALLYYEEARVHLREGRTPAGIARLKQALAEEPRYFDALLRLAEVLDKQGDYTAAVDYLERARVVNDRDARVYRLFGTMLLAQNKFVTATHVWREALRRDQNSANIYQGLGTALLALGLSEKDLAKRQTHFAEAQKHLLTSLERSGGKLLLSHFQLARLHEARGDLQLAQAELAALLRLDPTAEKLPVVRELKLRLQNTARPVTSVPQAATRP